MTERAAHRVIDADVSLQSLEKVQDELALWWDEVGEVPMRQRFAFETAVVEIAGNIIEHSGDPLGESGRRFVLDLAADEEWLHGRFQDNGIPAGVDLASVTMAGLDAESGRGLALVMASIDSLDYRFEGGRNVWSLRCRRE